MSDSTPATDRRSVLKDALRAVEEMQARLEAADRARNEPIAVVGLACRFPGDAETPELFWDLLRRGVDAVREVPADRWDARDYADLDPQAAASMSKQYGGFLSNLDRFDSHFFGIAPKEAVTLDPQQRLVLEVTWEALERAGQAPDRLRGSLTGVFIGITGFDFAQYLKSADPSRLDFYTTTGTVHNSAAGRVSYTLGLQGPALAVDTACSSSLTAIHLACQSLRLGESHLAVAGGVQIMLLPDPFVAFNKNGMLAPDGRCKTFDEAADGFVRAEGCGIVVLKRLSDAVASGDTIHAVIRGSAINQDGASSGLTVPNGPAQEAVIRQALRASGVEPSDVAYIEAHGTATTLGDPIELEALDAVLSAGRTADRALTVGSVKTNVGHLEAASGIAGFIKLVLAIERGEIPPHLHFNRLSSKITLRHQPMVVPTVVTPWPAWSERRIGGVSSFGFCGTNVHVVVERAPERIAQGTGPDRSPHVVMLTAKSERSLHATARQLDAYLDARPSASVGDIALTLNAGRARFAYRAAAVASTAAQLREQCSAIARGEDAAAVVRAQVRSSAGRPKVAFLFTGQGSQYTGMARRLYEVDAVFRAAIDRCTAALGADLDVPLLAVMNGESGGSGLLDRTDYTQPALFALEYALTELWKSWGVTPAAVMGHSVGEYAAACAAGVLTVEDGLRLIARRARLMSELPAGGTMAAVLADRARVAAAIGKREATVSIAALNGPNRTVISGPAEDVAAVQRSLDRDGVRTQKLTVSHAFHSSLMDPMLDAFRGAARATPWAAPRIPFISNLSGGLADAALLADDYWARHLRQPVRFQEGIEALRGLGCEIFLEIGPDSTLTTLGRECAGGAGVWLPSLRRGRDDWQELMLAVASVSVRGVEVDWNAIDNGSPRAKVALPTYPFERERYWVDKPPRVETQVAAGSFHPLLGAAVRSESGEIHFDRELTIDSLPFLKDHTIHGTTVVPGTAYVDLALAAAEVCLEPGAHVLTDLMIREPLPVRPADRQRLRVRCGPARDGLITIDVLSRPADAVEEQAEWRLKASCTAGPDAVSDRAAGDPLAAVEARCREELDVVRYRERLYAAGIQLGPSFSGLTQLRRGERESYGTVVLPEGAVLAGHRVHPALLDACFHALGGALPAELYGGTDSYVPIAIDRVSFTKVPGSRVACHVALRSDVSPTVETIRADVRLFDPSSELIGEITGLVVKRVTPEQLRHGIAYAAIGGAVFEKTWPLAPLTERQRAALGGRWLLWDAGANATDALARRIRHAGGTSEIVRVPPGAAEGLESARRLLGEAAARGPIDGVIYLGGLGASQRPGGVGAPGAIGDVGSQRPLLEPLLHLVRILASGDHTPRLCIVTRGAQAIQPGEDVALEQAPLLGLARSLAVEHPEFRCLCVDIDPGAAADESAAAIVDEIGSGGADDQVAYRAAGRHVARLGRRRAADLAPRRLEIAERGVLERLTWQPMIRRAPQPGEVEVRVAAAGLNFRDVLNALGVYAGGDVPLGNECAGTVSAVGEGVTDLAVGDPIFGLAFDCFSDYVTTPAPLVLKKPEAFSWGEAATIPIAFLTADYGLRGLANLRKGERVLIHAGAGGVGLAAIQVAQQIGAEIFATASPEKQAYVRELGVAHVYNSRTLAFADQINEQTGGRGVDVVLNSLTGDFIPRSLGLLPAGGRFVEIGKAGIWTSEQMAASRPDVGYSVLYLGDLTTEQLGARLRGIVGELQRGVLRPLRRREFGAGEAIDAFRFMAQAKHVGKLVMLLAAPAPDGARIDADASYLVTGGTGGLGLVVAEALCERGARHLVLASRGGAAPPASPAAATIEALRAGGATIAVVAADVATPAGAAAAVAAATKAGVRLGGIVHAAGVLDDGVIVEQTWERAAAVLAPKLAGAWNLHHATAGTPLDFFVMFSSMSAVLDTAGQGTYAAANAFLDGLAHVRRAHGLAAVSINWGPWADAGMAAALDERVKRRWRESGVTGLSNAEGSAAFQYLVASHASQALALNVDWPRFTRSRFAGRVPALLSGIVHPTSTSAAAAPVGTAAVKDRASSDFAHELAAMSPRHREPALRAHVREQIVRALGLDPGYSVDPQQGLRDLGMDSLMAVELRNRLQTTIGKTLPSTLAFDCPTLDALTDFLGRLVEIAPQAAPVVAAAPAVDRIANEPIAIVGMACRFPAGADSTEAFWDRLRNGVNMVTEVPGDRWNIDAYYDPNPDAPGKMYSRHGGFVGAQDRFDAAFFGISPREASSMDPQHRLMLETSWEAIEDASIAPDRLRGTPAGVFVGISSSDYASLHLRREVANIDAYFGTGTALSVAAGRVSYVLGLNGPSMAVDTACSSSLVSVHLAAQSLRRGECDLALAGGVNLILAPEITVNFSRARMLAPDGRCKTFDAAADGYVRGEGCGVVVLKRLSDAVAAGDRIVAVVLGSAVNQDGRSSGLTVPNGPAQQAVIRDALSDAGVPPAEVGYIEAHGTGTSLGDPIELQALGAVLSEGRPVDRAVAIGSVKTNIGHLEAAAGVAGLIKAALVLAHAEIPPHLHFTRLNPNASLAQLPSARIPTTLEAWPSGYERRVAGVSSFGFSGTNAHVVLGAAPLPAVPVDVPTRPIHLLTVSGRDDRAMRALADRWRTHFETTSPLTIADAVMAANAGRAHFAVRGAAVVRDLAEAGEALRAIAVGREPLSGALGQAPSEPPALAFFFGQSEPMVPASARPLYDTQPVFRAALDKCDGLVLRHAGVPLIPLLGQASGSGMNDAGVAAAVRFSLQYAEAEIWRSWGLLPLVTTGTGAGFCVAACVAGAASLESGLRIAVVAARAREGLDDPLVRLLNEMSFEEPSPALLSRSGSELSAGDLVSPDEWRFRPAKDDGDALASLRAGSSGEAIEISGADPTWHSLLTKLAVLYTRGVSVNWAAVDGPYARARVALPTYPFDRQRYWLDQGDAIAAPRPDIISAAATAAAHQSGFVPLDLPIHNYADYWAALDRITHGFVIEGLRALGIFAGGPEARTVDDLVARAGIKPIYAKTLGRWLDALVVRGILQRNGDSYVSQGPPPVEPLAAMVADLRMSFRSAQALVDFVERAGRSVAAVLIDRARAIDALFPDGSFDVAEALYERSSGARYTNGIVAAAVRAAAQTRAGRGKLRILEIGAGVGGTTAAVLPQIASIDVTYHFTDISNLFLVRAEEKFKAYPFVRFGLLDLEQDSDPQGYPAGAFDVVLATNVLHATQSLPEALDRVRQLLAPGGILVVNESTTHPSWFDLALIEGWQRYDDELRDESPTLTVPRWEAALRDHGFDTVSAHPGEGSPAEILGDHVIIARATPTGVEAVADAARLAALDASAAVGRSADGAASVLRARLAEAIPGEREDILIEYVSGHVARVLRFEAGRAVDRRSRLMDLGVDSLMAVELRNRLSRGLGVDDDALPATLIFDHPTVEAIGVFLDRQVVPSGGASATAADTALVDEDAGASVTELSRLTDEEAELLLLEKLGALGSDS